jgi:hypothetical protein
MKHRSGVVFRFFVFAIFLLAARTVTACVCSNADYTVLGKFEDARFVVIAKALAVEKSSDGETIRTKMVIEKVYKGNLRVGHEMIFGQGEGGNCFKQFDEDDVGVKFLFYLKPKEKTPRVWYADGCEKSRPLPGFNTNHINNAADDLSYLEKMDKVTGKTRISGTLISHQWSFADGGADFKRVAATKVRLIGEQQTYQAETDKDGVYEIYDLPPGRYKVEPETPKGWAIENPSVFGGGGSSGREGEHFQLTLKKGRHAYFDFFFIADTRIQGRVFDPSGNPMNWVCVNLVPTEGKVSEHFKRDACTGQDGSFKIDEIPFGRYFLVVNSDDKISNYEPFRRFYYPNVYEPEKAEVVTITEGDHGKTIDIHIPEVKDVVDIEGFFLSADRKPVTRASVIFDAEKTDEQTTGYAFDTTDENGKFSLRVLKGLQGKIFGVVRLDESEFRECPKVVASLKTNRRINWQHQKTDAVEIQIQGNVDKLELKLPFASCKGGRIVSEMRID